MRAISWKLTLPLVLCLVAFALSDAQPQRGAPPDSEIVGLIDKLTAVEEGGVGYSPTMTGSSFLPLGTSRSGALLLGQTAPEASRALRELVARGAAAVPDLLAHLDDRRPTKLPVVSGFDGVFFQDEYDYNSRLAPEPPKGVSRRHELGEGNHPRSHTVTVGDLCFVALGQIVNREFNAVRYQPTACVMINSPTHSERLRKAVKKDWGDLTPERHKESLARDFLEPDHERRRIGACERLAYYYPQSLEPLVLKQLAQPRYDVFVVEKLIREELYRTPDVSERKRLFESFVSRHGEVARDGMLLYLFDDLRIQEADEQGRTSPPLKEKYAARECLIDLYGYSMDVESADQPDLQPTEDAMQARFIDSLGFFPTPKIDEAVRKVLQSTDDDYLASACARYLVVRGGDADVQKYVERRRDAADESRRAELDRMLDRLGWTALHVAAEKDRERVELLIAQGADVNARAQNGQTPLHVAAQHGSFGAIHALLAGKADPNKKDARGRTPIQFAISYPYAVEILLEAGAEIPDILVASFAGRADLVSRFLAEDKGLAGAVTPSGETPLHLAAQYGHLAVARILLANGASVNARDRSQITPLHYAADRGAKEMVELLLAREADREARAWDGRTPAGWAKGEATPLLVKRPFEDTGPPRSEPNGKR